MSYLKKPAVKRVRKALSGAGLTDTVIELDDTARTAQDAADATGADLGAIIKSLVFLVGEQPVLALVAGDHVCLPENLPRALNLQGEVRKTDAAEVKAATGFTIGGVAPVGLIMDLPVAIDVSLKRFDTLYAAAGHPHCVFPVTVPELKKLTGGIVSYNFTRRK
ncbi:MAG TPA: YbaK/EbsC family protein [Rhodospirillales bacterium]|nr:YbaK/EbsC family protein [Rhodospirillales bacterium]